MGEDQPNCSVCVMCGLSEEWIEGIVVLQNKRRGEIQCVYFVEHALEMYPDRQWNF